MSPQQILKFSDASHRKTCLDQAKVIKNLVFIKEFGDVDLSFSSNMPPKAPKEGKGGKGGEPKPKGGNDNKKGGGKGKEGGKKGK